MRISALVALALLPACAPVPEHGPVDAKTLRRLDSNAITRTQFLEGLRSPALQQSLVPATGVVTVPFKLVNGTPWIEAGINTSPRVPMMLDTGAGRMLVHARTAADLNMTLVRAEDMQVQMHGVVGSEQGRVGVINPLRLGAWRVEGYPCFVRTHENRLGSQSFPSNIFGFDLPSRVCSWLTLDYPRGQATFAFRGSFQPRAASRVTKTPFRLSKNVPFIKITTKGVTWEALVDSGSFNGIEISQDIAVKLGVQDQGRAVKDMYLLSVGGTVSSRDANLRVVTLPEITLCGDTYKQADVDISPGIPRVGSYFLKDYRVTFDFRRKLLWLELP